MKLSNIFSILVYNVNYAIIKHYENILTHYLYLLLNSRATIIFYRE